MAIAVFADPDLVVLDASREEDDENRLKAIGRIDGKVFVVVFTKRGLVTRVISARRADRREERAYGDGESRA